MVPSLRTSCVVRSGPGGISYEHKLQARPDISAQTHRHMMPQIKTRDELLQEMRGQGVKFTEGSDRTWLVSAVQDAPPRCAGEQSEGRGLWRFGPPLRSVHCGRLAGTTGDYGFDNIHDVDDTLQKLGYVGRTLLPHRDAALHRTAVDRVSPCDAVAALFQGLFWRYMFGCRYSKAEPEGHRYAVKGRKLGRASVVYASGRE